jgi:RHS repeat-associated protein
LTASITAPDAGSGPSQTLYDYNKDRQLSQIALPTGQTISLGYDSAGRLSTLTLPTGQLSNTYDPATGNVASVSAPGGISLAYTYDGSLLTGTTWSGPVAGSVRRTYNNNFLTASLSVDGGTPIAFQYDTDNLLTKAGDLTLTYDAKNGSLTGTTLGGVTDAITYAPSGNPASYTASVSGTAAYSVQYTYDQSGRITQKVETIGGTTGTYAYSYDQVGRLTRVQKDSRTIAAYTYDGNGNRLSETTPGGTVTGTYDNRDRLLTYGNTAYQYDANGTLLSKTQGGQTTTYQYDALGNLLHVTLPNGTRIDYLVDGQGRRIGKEVNGVLVQGFLYQDSLRPVAELDGNGNIVATFVYGSWGNVPDYMIKDGVTYRIISDQVGSPRMIINTATGQIVQRLDYDAFGKVILDTNPGFQPFGFTGGLYDRDTGLIRFGARDYDPQTGRWLSSDPLRFEGGDSNLYAYARNDPVNLTDPLGLQPFLPGAWVPNLDMIRAFFNFFGPQDQSAQWWADQFERTDTWNGKLGYGLGGCLASLWTPDTYGKTLAALGLAAGASQVLNLYKVPETLYHFTSWENAAGILETGAIEPASGTYGEGVYLTRFNSSIMATLQGASSTEAAFQVSTEGLIVQSTPFPGTFLVSGSVPIP